MVDQLPYCIHCGAQQLNADARFCHRCGQPIVPVKPKRQQLPPWAGPVLVSAGILIVAAIVFVRLLTGGPAAGQPAAAPPALLATTYTPTPARPLPSPTVPAALPTGEATPTRETPTPPPTETPQPTPTLANITPEPVKLSRLAWSPDGKLLAVGSGTGVYLYDTATWQEVRFIQVQVSIPPQLDDAPRELAFSFDSTMLAAPVIGRVVQVWQVADGVLAYTIDGTTPLAASPTEGLWATFGPFSGASRGIHLWRTDDGQLVQTIPSALLHPNTMAFSPDGRLLAVGSAPGDPPSAWQVTDGRQVAQLNWPNAERYYWQSVAFHPNATTVASAGSDIGVGVQNVFVLWDARRGAVIREIIGQSAPSQQANIRRVCYAPDGSLLAAYFGDYSGRENRVQLWSADGAAGRSWSLPGPASDIGFTPDGKLLTIAEGERIAFYDSATGTLIRQIVPQWHQGILPTPPPTPLAQGLKLPDDWRAYYALHDSQDSHFKVRIPPTWTAVDGTNGLFTIPSSSSNPYTRMQVRIMRVYCDIHQMDSSGQPNLESIIKGRVSNSTSEWTHVFVSSGKWPYVIPANYAEFDFTYLEGPHVPSALAHRKTRQIVLEWRSESGQCVIAELEDELEDIREQDRLDLSYVLASIEFEDTQHPFPTATATFTPTPNPAPPPALPLQISFNAKTSRGASGGGEADIDILIRDAAGNPVNNAEVVVSCGWACPTSKGITQGGHHTTSYGFPSVDDRTMKVEVYWNQELIAQQDFVISWE